MLQTDRTDAADNADDYIPLALDGTDDRDFARSVRTGCPAIPAALALVPVLVFATDESFIDLHNASELGFRLDHRGADFVAHAPSRPVTAEAHKPHDLEGTHALFGREHEMGDLEPVPQRLIRVLEDGPGDAGKPIAVLSAGFALPVEWARPQRIDLHIAAAGAKHAIRPPAGHQIGLAGVLIPDREQDLKLCAAELVDRGWFRHGKSSFVEGYNHA